MGWLIVPFVGFLMRRLQAQERQQLVVHILDSLGALPLHDIISQSESGETLIAGKAMDMEKAKVLQEAARTALNNQALILIREQVVYETFTASATKAVTGEDLTFYRSALWWGQRIEYYLRLLAQRQQEPDL